LAYLGENVLIVSHGAVMRSLLIYFDYGDYKNLSHGCINNAGYLIIESDGVDFFLKEVNGVNKL
jgi:broad specificity phosphatase PhoE